MEVYPISFVVCIMKGIIKEKHYSPITAIGERHGSKTDNDGKI